MCRVQLVQLTLITFQVVLKPCLSSKMKLYQAIYCMNLRGRPELFLSALKCCRILCVFFKPHVDSDSGLRGSGSRYRAYGGVSYGSLSTRRHWSGVFVFIPELSCQSGGTVKREMRSAKQNHKAGEAGCLEDVQTTAVPARLSERERGRDI